VPLSLFTHPAVHHIRVQAMRQGHASYAGARLGAAFQHLCLELLAVLTPPWAVVIQRIFHRLHDPPSWGRCPLQAVFSRWDRQLHTHCLPSAKRQAPSAKRQAPSAKRQELGLTKAKMAQLLKVSGVSLYKWEKGSILPRSKQLDRVKVVLKMWPRQAQRAIAAE
jgi:DNA-binding XRE family transcriptional regulator